MPIQPPSDALFAQPAMEPMELFGRMRALTIARGCTGTLPVIWQCSDESQGIKRALFGYAFDCPSFNLVLVVAGLTLDHSIRRNTVIPQFGWLMERESSQQGQYLDPPTVTALLASQPIFRPPKSYLKYAGVS